MKYAGNRAFRAGLILALGWWWSAAALGAGAVTVDQLELAGKIQGEAFAFDLTCTAQGAHAGASVLLVGGEVALAAAPEGQGWRLVYDAAAPGYLLEIQEGTGPVTVKASFVARTRPEESRPTWRHVTVALAPARVRQVSVETAVAGLDLELPGALQMAREDVAGKVTARGVLRPDSPFEARWQAHLRPTESKLLASSEVNLIVAVSPGTLRLDALVNYAISQGSLRELNFAVPKELNVTQVRGPSLQDWFVRDTPEGRALVVRLSREQDKQYRLQLLGEAPLGAFPAETVIPVIQPLDGTRTDGFVALATESAIQLQVREAVGLVQVDPAAFPRLQLAEDQARPVPDGKAFFYSFAALPFRLSLGLADIVPTMDTESRLTLTVRDDDLVLDGALDVDVRDAPVRSLQITIPGGYLVSSVTGPAVADHAVSDVPGGTGRLITVELREPVSGRTVVQFRLEMGKSPLGATHTLEGIGLKGARTERGFVVVVADAGVLLDAPEAENLRQVNTRSLPLRVADAQYAWRFREPGWRLRLAVRERPASVRAEAFHLLSLGEGVCYGSVALTYVITGAPVDEFRFRVAEGLQELEFVGLDVSRWVVEDGIWQVKLRSKVSGDYNLGVTYSQKVQEGSPLLVGGVACAGVETETGFLVVATHLNLRIAQQDVSPSLIPIGPDEVPGQYRLMVSAPIERGFKYVGEPHTAALNVSAYARGETPAVLVEFIAARTEVNVDREGKAESVTRVRFTVRNSSAQFLDLSVPEGTHVWNVRQVEADGSTGAKIPAAADQGLLKIPLRRERNPNQPLTLEVEYGRAHGKLGWLGKLDLALPLSRVRSTYAEWTVAVPAGWAVTALDGGTANPAAVVAPSPLGQVGAAVLAGWVSVWSGSVPLGLAALAVLALVVGALSHRRWLSLSGGVCLLGLLLFFGVQARQRARLPGPGPEAVRSLDLNQVLDLDAQTPISARVRVVRAWREDVQFGRAAFLALAGGLAAVAAVRRQSALSRGLSAVIALTAAAALAAQFAGGRQLLLHALTWGAPLLALGLAARRVYTAWLRPRPGAGAAGVVCLVLLALGLGGATAPAAEPPPIVAVAPAGEPPSVALHAAAAAPALVQRLVCELVVKEDCVAVQLGLTISAAGPFEFPIAPRSAVVTLLEGEATLGQAMEQHLLRGDAGRREVRLSLLCPLPDAAEDQARQFRLPLPPCLFVEAVATLPGGGLDVSFPTAVQSETTEDEKQTRVSARLAPGPELQLNWRPRGRRTQTEQTVFYADVTSLARADSGVVEALHRVSLRVAQGELAAVTVRIPEAMVVTTVVGVGLGGWRFDPATRDLLVSLDTPITGDWEMTVTTQTNAPALPHRARLGILSVAAAARQTGALGVFATPAVTLEIGAHPAAMNPDDFSREAKAQIERLGPAETIQAYRIADPQATLELTVSAVAPEVRTEERGSFSLSDERLVYSTTLAVDVAKAGIFAIDIETPEGYDVDSLTCPDLTHWDESTVDGRRIVRAHLQKRLLGAAEVAVAISRAVTALPDTVDVPRLAVVGALKHHGELVVSAERGVRLSVLERDGVSEVETTQPGLREPGALAFRVLRQSWALRLRTEVMSPRINVEALHVAEVTEGLVRHRQYLRFRLQNAGARSFEVEVPPAVLGLVISGSEIARRQLLDPATGRWRIELSQKWFDQPYSLGLSYETRFSQEEGSLQIAPVKAVGAEQQRGFVVVRTSGRVELTVVQAAGSLQPSEARAVPGRFGAGDLADAALCYATTAADYDLTLRATRHEAAQVLDAEVLEARLTSVVNERLDSLHQVALALRAGGRRILRCRLPPGADVWSLLVDRQSRTPTFTGPETAEAGRELLIPLPQGAGSDIPVAVDLTYILQPPAGKRAPAFTFDGPRFDLPLRNISWVFYVPAKYRYHDFKGTLTPDPEWGRGERVSRYDLKAYQDVNLRLNTADLQKAVSLQERGLRLARDGNQKEARQALEQAYSYSQSDRALNEDARVNLRQLLRQQAVVGLVNRRGDVRQADEQGATAQAPSEADRFTQAEAERVQNSLSKTDSENLDRITGRMLDIQEAAAAATMQLMVGPPLHGRVIAFRRALQVEKDAPMRVAFQASAPRLVGLLPFARGVLAVGGVLLLAWLLALGLATATKIKASACLRIGLLGGFLAGVATLGAEPVRPPPAAPGGDGAVVAFAPTATRVVVHPGWARVEREGECSVPAGQTRVTFRPGSAGVVDGSALAWVAAGAAQVTGVEARASVAKDAHEATLKQLEEGLAVLTQAVAQARTDQDGAKLDLEYLARLTPWQAEQALPKERAVRQITAAEISELADYLSKARTQALTRQVDAAHRQRTAEEESARRQRDLEALRQRGPERSIALTIDLAASAPAAVRLVVSYVVPGASWYPQYLVQDGAKPGDVRLQLVGVVQQATGEAWDRANLTLSLQPPLRAGVSRPEDAAWLSAVVGGLARPAPESGPVAVPTGWEGLRAAWSQWTAIQEPAAQTAAASRVRDNLAAAAELGRQLGFRGTAWELTCAGEATLRADGTPALVTACEGELTPKLTFHLTPAVSPRAVLSGRVRNEGPGAWLPGAVTRPRLGSGASLGAIEYTAVGDETEIPLGTSDTLSGEKRVGVARPLEPAPGGKVQTAWPCRLIVRNSGATPADVELADFLPAPGGGADIRLLESVPRATVAPGGRLTWSLNVPPNGSAEVTYTVQAAYPADQPPALLQALLPRKP